MRTRGRWCHATTLGSGVLFMIAAGCQVVADIGVIELANESVCRDYCREVMNKCTEDYSVYSSDAQCLAVCNAFSAGKPTDRTGGTVSCRINQVHMLASGEAGNCPAAGPGGDGVCGDNCANYCLMMSRACGAKDHTQYWLGDRKQCVNACRGLRDLSLGSDAQDITYSAENERSRDHNGDTVQCRLFHAAAASEGAETARSHCWHAALYPMLHTKDVSVRNPCLTAKANDAKLQPNCEDYCRVVSVACMGDAAIYQTEAQCLSSCSANGFEPGKLSDDRLPDGAMRQDTLGCRYSHAYQALISETDPERRAECAKASASGDEACGPRCDVFCNQLERSCGELPQYDCRSACREMADRSTPYSLANASSGKFPFACRIRAMVEARAAESPAEVEVKCQAAIGAPGSACE